MKTGYRVKANKHSHLKWVVRGKEHGKWTRKYFWKKVEADTYAQLKNTELLNLGHQGAELPIELRLMAMDCQRRLADFGKTILDAVNFYIPHLTKAKRAISVKSVADEVVAAKKSNGIKESTLKVYRHRVKQFCVAFGESEVSSVTSEDIGNWLIRSFAHPVTRNNNRRVLVNLFNFAKSRRYVEVNPATEITTAKQLSKDVGILRPEQVSQLLAHSNPSILPYFAIGAFAGIRPEELLKLEWGDIKWRQGIIRVRAEVSKVGKTRNVALEANLRAWLAPYHQGAGRICPANWRRLFRNVRLRAGVTDWPSDCLRHSFATYWLEKYKDAPRLALEMGNSVGVIMNHYHRVLDDPADGGRYWSIIPGEKFEWDENPRTRINRSFVPLPSPTIPFSTPPAASTDCAFLALWFRVGWSLSFCDDLKMRVINMSEITVQSFEDCPWYFDAFCKGVRVGYARCTPVGSRLNIGELFVESAKEVPWRWLNGLRVLLGIKSSIINFRRCGVGSMLLDHVIAKAAQTGVTEVWGSVTADDIKANDSLLDFYGGRDFDVCDPDDECVGNAVKKIVKQLTRR